MKVLELKDVKKTFQKKKNLYGSGWCQFFHRERRVHRAGGGIRLW